LHNAKQHIMSTSDAHFAKLGIKRGTILAYNAKANGGAESNVKSARGWIKNLTPQGHSEDWDLTIDQAQFEYNTSPHVSHGCIPAEVFSFR